jgi:type IV secretory pathway TrbD component
MLEGKKQRVPFWPPITFVGFLVAVVGLILRDWGIAGIGIGIAVLGPISATLYWWLLEGVRRMVQRLSSKRDGK